MSRTKAEKAQLKRTRYGIPETEYGHRRGLSFVTFRQIEAHHTLHEVQKFDEWFEGQTGTVLEDGTCVIFAYDYERWLGEGMGHQQKSNWD